MNWQKIDPENLPEGEVLVSFESSFLLGFLYIDHEGEVVCEQEQPRGGVALHHPRYYVTLPELANTLPPDNPSDELE